MTGGIYRVVCARLFDDFVSAPLNWTPIKGGEGFSLFLYLLAVILMTEYIYIL